MTFDSDVNKYEIYAHVVKVDNIASGYGFLHSNNQAYEHIENDVIIPIFLTRKNDYSEYVDIKLSDPITSVDRQQVDPYFIELGFFDGLQTGELRKGYQLSSAAITYIKERRVDVASMSSSQIRTWYDTIGYLELPWNINDSDLKTTVYDIENNNTTVATIVGKAKVYNININK